MAKHLNWAEQRLNWATAELNRMRKGSEKGTCLLLKDILACCTISSSPPAQSLLHEGMCDMWWIVYLHIMCLFGKLKISTYSHVSKNFHTFLCMWTPERTRRCDDNGSTEENFVLEHILYISCSFKVPVSSEWVPYIVVSNVSFSTFPICMWVW